MGQHRRRSVVDPRREEHRRHHRGLRRPRRCHRPDFPQRDPVRSRHDWQYTRCRHRRPVPIRHGEQPHVAVGRTINSVRHPTDDLHSRSGPCPRRPDHSHCADLLQPSHRFRAGRQRRRATDRLWHHHRLSDGRTSRELCDRDGYRRRSRVRDELTVFSDLRPARPSCSSDQERRSKHRNRGQRGDLHLEGGHDRWFGADGERDRGRPAPGRR